MKPKGRYRVAKGDNRVASGSRCPAGTQETILHNSIASRRKRAFNSNN